MEPDQSLLLRITTIARIVKHRFDQRAREIGVTRAQWRTIATVKLASGSTQREIAEMLEVREVTAGRHIDRLCDQNWAERRPDTADRRVNRIYLTTAADPLLDELGKLADAEQTCALQGFSASEIALFQDFLRRLDRNLVSSAHFTTGPDTDDSFESDA